jgi:hypothetical protein
LPTIIHCQLEYQCRRWYHAPMNALRKITVQVAESDLELAQAYTGEGVTETVRAGLKRLASMKAQQELLKLRGKVKFSKTSEELKYDRK